MTVEVLVEVKYLCLSKSFAYQVPQFLEKEIKIGKRVKVPFGTRIVEGFVISFSFEKKYDFALKDIIKVVDQVEVLNKELLKLGQYMQKKTFSPLIYCYQTMLPKGIKASANNKIVGKKEKYLKIGELKKVSSAGQKVLDLFLENEFVKKSEALKVSSAVKTLLKNNVLIEFEKEEEFIIEKSNLKLNFEQNNCFNEILKKKNQFAPFLLHGVTGSGKTEIYLRVIEEVLKEEKSVIMLVPEISLTPQIVKLFQRRFGNQVAVFHSHLTDVEKYHAWLDMKNNRVKVVIGARSAVFAPFNKVGLIIVDEEHALTYKQENIPKYHTIDIALWRGQYHKCPVILAGATPSVESYTRAKMGIYQLLEIKKTINQFEKKITVIDMKNEIKSGNRYLSNLLVTEIKKCLERKEQVILFLNRRGFSTTLVCRECGETMKCPNCEVSLTYHKQTNSMKCHYCFYEKKYENKCFSCNSLNIRHFGLGTQKLEEEIVKSIGLVRMVRMDVDSTRKRGSHGTIIGDFDDQKYDILIGTQMVAKGLDFANVTLVGVINGDAGLNVPDFRSAERTFQLINQVAGRAGRIDKIGQVIVQCFNPSHYSIKCALDNDYLGFYEEEMDIRKKLNYPPFVNLALLRISATDFNYLFNEADKIARDLRKNKKLIVLGPTVGSVLKKNKQFIVNVIIKYYKKEDIVVDLEKINEMCGLLKVRIDIDVNPLSM